MASSGVEHVMVNFIKIMITNLVMGHLWSDPPPTVFEGVTAVLSLGNANGPAWSNKLKNVYNVVSSLLGLSSSSSFVWTTQGNQPWQAWL